MVIVNKMIGKCQSCSNSVAPGKGFAYKNGHRWLTACASKACIQRLGLTIPDRVLGGGAERRELLVNGQLFCPYDRDATYLLRSLPPPRGKPSWDKAETCRWVSLADEDLPRVIEVCDKLRVSVPDELRKRMEVGTEDTQLADARAATKGLYDFQRDGVRFLALHKRALLADEMGCGKAQPVDCKILTPTGWMEIGSLKVGDTVIGSAGTPVKVTAVYPRGMLPVFRVVMNDGASTRCCAEHLWRVQTANDRFRGGNTRVMSLEELMSEGVKDSYGNSRWFVPLVKPIQFTTKTFPLHPYLLGALIANGGFSQHAVFHSGGKDQRALFEHLLPQGVELVDSGDGVSYRISTRVVGQKNPVMDALRAMGLMGKLSPEKFIPHEYMFGSVEQRLDLLRGLFDNDGTSSGYKIEYNTTSPILAEQVIALIRSLGGSAWMTTRKPKYTYGGEKLTGKTDYRINLAAEFNPFLLKRKADKVTTRSKYPPIHSIASIEPAGSTECVCIAVESDDHMYVTEDYILTHNTIQALVALPNNPRVLLICPASLKYNWRDEAAKWRPDLRVTVLSGRESFKVPERGEIVAINFDILPSFLKPKQKKDEEGRLVFSTSGKPVMEYKIPEELQKDFADVHIIIDEAQRVKNYKTQRAQKVTALTMAAGGDWMLTGTPVENNPPELFGVLEVGRMARTVFGNYQIFFRLFNGQKNRWGGTEWGEPSPEVPERLRRVMLRRLKKEVLKDLPPKRYQYITVNDVGEALSEEMDEALKDWDNNYEEDYLPSFEQFSAVLNKLAEARIPAMLEIVESYEESETPLVVFSAHKAPLHALAKRDGWEIITGDTRATDRHAIVSAFQSGALKGVGVSIAAGGVGLTLTRASDELFVDRLWNPSANIQAEDRCHRIGATGERILIKLLTSNHPLDKRINMLLDKKQRLIEKTMDALVKPKLRGPAAKANIELVCETKEQLRQRVELVDETEEQLAERIERAAREAEEHEAKDKVARILDRERKRALGVSNALPEPELTTKRKALIRDALGFLAAHCDGAVMRDQQGFNKPDAMIGHWLNATGLRDDDEVSLRVAERILSRYYRQLHEAGFDSIWRPELE